MNAIQYYIIDSYIKAKPHAQHHRLAGEASDDEDGGIRRTSTDYRSRHSFDEADDIFLSDDNSDSDGGIYVTPMTKPTTVTSSDKRLAAEYNPDIDGINPAGKLPRRPQSQPVYPQPESSSSSTYTAVREGRTGVGKGNKLLALTGADSLASMMMLPGSRGPSTPGYADDSESRRLTLGSGRSARSGKSARSVRSLGGLDGDDERTLVGMDDEESGR